MKTRSARTGRNPQTGLPVEIPASTVLTFKAAKPKA
jgi:nucleoid DNA-binding protein